MFEQPENNADAGTDYDWSFNYSDIYGFDLYREYSFVTPDTEEGVKMDYILDGDNFPSRNGFDNGKENFKVNVTHPYENVNYSLRVDGKLEIQRKGVDNGTQSVNTPNLNLTNNTRYNVNQRLVNLDTGTKIADKDMNITTVGSRVSWDPVNPNVNYRVYRNSSGSDFNYGDGAYTMIGDTPDQEFLDFGLNLSLNDQYNYRVTAYNFAGESEPLPITDTDNSTILTDTG